METKQQASSVALLHKRIADTFRDARGAITKDDLKISGAVKNKYPYIPTAAAVDAIVVAAMQHDLVFAPCYLDEMAGDGYHMFALQFICTKSGDTIPYSKFKIPIALQQQGKANTNVLADYAFAMRIPIMAAMGISASMVEEQSNQQAALAPPVIAPPVQVNSADAGLLPPLPPDNILSAEFYTLRELAEGYATLKYALPPDEYLSFVSRLEALVDHDPFFEPMSEDVFIREVIADIKSQATDLGHVYDPVKYHIRNILHRWRGFEDLDGFKEKMRKSGKSLKKKMHKDDTDDATNPLGTVQTYLPNFLE